MAADRTPFHLSCLKCGHCQKKLTPATLNEHHHKLYCPLCYEELFCQKEGDLSTWRIFSILLLQDNIPERTVMQVLPIQGLFIVVYISSWIYLTETETIKLQEKTNLKEEFLSPEEIRKREEAAAAARAWKEATQQIDCLASSIKIREAVEIAPEDSITL